MICGVSIYPECFWHDIPYGVGGSKLDRLKTDQRFCVGVYNTLVTGGVDETRALYLAEILYSAVRAGGADTALDMAYEWDYLKLV